MYVYSTVTESKKFFKHSNKHCGVLTMVMKNKESKTQKGAYICKSYNVQFLVKALEMCYILFVEVILEGVLLLYYCKSLSNKKKLWCVINNRFDIAYWSHRVIFTFTYSNGAGDS